MSSCEKLRKQLRVLERVKGVEVRSDHDVGGGAEWEREIRLYLNAAQIIVLLMSPDFMASDHCYHIEKLLDGRLSVREEGLMYCVGSYRYQDCDQSYLYYAHSYLEWVLMVRRIGFIRHSYQPAPLSSR